MWQHATVEPNRLYDSCTSAAQRPLPTPRLERVADRANRICAGRPADKRYKLAFLTTGKYQYVNKTKIAGNLSRSGDEVQVALLDLYARALVPIDPARAIAAAEGIQTANRERILSRVKRLAQARARATAREPAAQQRTAPRVERENDDDVGLETLLAPDPITGGDDPSSAAKRGETP